MTKEIFLELLKQYRIINEYVAKYEKLGIQLYEGEYPIMDPVNLLFETTLKGNFNEFGIDWINWFIFENNFGDNKLEAYESNGDLICQTEEELYNYIQQYKI